MPLLQSLTTYFAINASNDTSPSGLTDAVTGQPIYIPDLDTGVYFDLTTSEAKSLSDTLIGTLYQGRYRRVKVDSGATAANVKTGTIGLMPSLAAIGEGTTTNMPLGSPTANVVTSYDQSIGGIVYPVVFLNTVTPGNYCFVQELGIATVLCGATIQKGSPAIGDLIDSATGGVVNDLTAQAFAVTSLGKAVDLPTPNRLIRIALSLPDKQG